MLELKLYRIGARVKKTPKHHGEVFKGSRHRYARILLTIYTLIKIG